MVLITLIIIAILFFTVLYFRTVSEYFTLLRKIEPVIGGEFKSGFLFNSIHLVGEYDGRQIVCGVEQLRDGGDALFVKIKLHEPSPEKKDLEGSRFSKKVVLFGGWIQPRLYIRKNDFNNQHLINTLDQLSRICDELERSCGQFKIKHGPGNKVEYKTDYQ
ncbi:MAG: hypothetical protein GY858_06760 [Candidatus Omnitrophica bacterium]|nr:hypothetical protein [Candidatus Omnitrophota bacterium]